MKECTGQPLVEQQQRFQEDGVLEPQHLWFILRRSVECMDDAVMEAEGTLLRNHQREKNRKCSYDLFSGFKIR